MGWLHGVSGVTQTELPRFGYAPGYASSQTPVPIRPPLQPMSGKAVIYHPKDGQVPREVQIQDARKMPSKSVCIQWECFQPSHHETVLPRQESVMRDADTTSPRHSTMAACCLLLVRERLLPAAWAASAMP